MKKIILVITTLLIALSLTGCYKPEVDNHITDVVEKIALPTSVSNSFNLLLAKENVSLSWESNNSSIRISNDRAIVTQGDTDINVNLTLTAKRNEDTLTKVFPITVLKKEVIVVEYPIYTIEEVFELDDDSKVLLENVTVCAMNSSGTHFTDGLNTIYAYGLKNLELGGVYEVKAVKTSYGDTFAAPQIKEATATQLSEEPETLLPTSSSIEELQDKDNGYFNINATVKVEKDDIYLEDNNFTVLVSSYNDSTSSNLLKELNNENLNLNVYIIGGKEVRTVYVYLNEEELDITDDIKVKLASNSLDIKSSVKDDITLPLTGRFNTTITWSSNNEDVLSSEGLVNRLEDDTTVTLTATIKLNNTTITKTFDVVVVSSLQIEDESLFISEYYEGKSYDKYIEIYNPNDSEVYLEGYSVKVGIDGAEFSLDINLTGVLGANETIVIASTDNRLNESIKTAVTNMGANGMFNELAYRINGNDAIGLFNDGELVDVFGVPGEKVSSKWNLADGGSTVDHRIIRKPGYKANPIWDTTEWTSTAISASAEHIDDLGKHTFIVGGSV